MAPHAETQPPPSTATTTPIKDTYRGPRHGIEYNRLRTQHDLVKYQEGGKLIQSPLALTNPSLRILDSATGDGQWLIEVADVAPATAELVGTDLAPQFFTKEADRPANVTLTTHSIFERWPEAFRGSFDLVHQRFVLAVASDAGAQDALEKLYECVKPGGWIEVHEGDMETVEDDPVKNAAMIRFRDMMVKAWTGLGHQPSPGPRLAEWLGAVGATDVQEKVQVIKAGARNEDPVQGERALLTLLGLLDSIQMFLGGKPGFFFSPEDFKKLRVDLEDELRTVGNSWHFHIAWAKKPE
ncbi:S-adenosyl-L-methionine-dependent methyltransferase [Lepidopterella palustris CBS 459.81]|uniref:S-adenosyl-L-methionine-dependent methyltransferase n=1 Tax=Lepidopterella palustris CBS 459.81 TaxID=1314670 RepID=A0A8E2JKT3_9PEZI|nr:S-adenosyl-L-methionine-dependent methyltransferase [Lepidopterella palustris CBS 459.81]